MSYPQTFTGNTSVITQPLYPQARQSVLDTIRTGQVDRDTQRILRYQLGDSIRGIRRNINIQVPDTVTNALAPTSSFMGQTLGAATAVLRDPLGAIHELPGTLGALLDRVNPGARARWEATLKKYKVEKWLEFPSRVATSIGHYLQYINGLLTLPITILNDIYFGLQDLLDEIEGLISDVYNQIYEAALNIIDQLFPGLTDFLSALTDFLNQISGIVTVFAGANQITGIINQSLGYVRSVGGILQNPLDLLFTFAPQQVSQGLYVLSNPQALINQFLPPELSQWFRIATSISGLGFNGNMGYGFVGVLDGLSQGVVGGILGNFSSQYSILRPLFNPVINPNSQPSSYPAGPAYSAPLPANAGNAQTNATGKQAQTSPPKPIYQPKNPVK